MKKKGTSAAGTLRRRAEELLSAQAKNHARTRPAKKSQAGTLRLMQELQIHQIELEMQNEELKHAKAEVEASLEQYTDLYDFAPVGYFTLAADGTIQLVNLTGATLVGIERSRLVGRSFPMLLSAAVRPAFTAFLSKALASEEKHSHDFELISPAPPLRHVHLDAQRLASGVGCRVMMMDITERKQAETVLRQNEAFFSALIAHTPIGVIVVDENLRLIQVNPTAEPLFQNVQPLLNRDFGSILQVLWSRKIAEDVLARFRHTLTTGEPYHAPEFTQRRRDTGVKEVYEWQLQRVILPTGAYRVVAFYTDITERKRAEQAQHRLTVLTASNAKLKQEITRREASESALMESEQRALRLLDESRELQKQVRHVSHRILTAQETLRKEISHELHDKISQHLLGINIRLAVFHKVMTSDPRSIRQALAQVRRQVEESVRVVHQFARELRPAMLDDLGLIPALRTYIEEIPKRKGRRISFTASPGVEVLDNDMRTVLYRVAQEALVNIGKHAQANTVHVLLRKDRRTVCLEVTDNGKSFDTARLSSVAWSKRLGLTGMRERVEMAGGTFTILSTPGTGTTVRAVVPFGKRRKEGELYAFHKSSP